MADSGRGVGVRQVVWFNYPMYLAAVGVAGGLGFATWARVFPSPLALLVAFGGALAAWWLERPAA